MTNCPIPHGTSFLQTFTALRSVLLSSTYVDVHSLARICQLYVLYVCLCVCVCVCVCSEGTHYYHAHTGSIRAEGTYGAVIFKSRTPKHHYDDELSLILSDWYHQSVTELTAGRVER